MNPALFYVLPFYRCHTLMDVMNKKWENHSPRPVHKSFYSRSLGGRLNSLSNKCVNNPLFDLFFVCPFEFTIYWPKACVLRVLVEIYAFYWSLCHANRDECRGLWEEKMYYMLRYLKSVYSDKRFEMLHFHKHHIKWFIAIAFCCR